MSMMRNERGATLMEVLAVTLVMTIVLGGGLLLMYSLNGMMRSSSAQYEKGTDMRETIHLISMELTDSVSAFQPAPNELRYVRGDQTKKALVYTDSSLVIFTFSGTDAQFGHPDVHYAASPQLYENRRLVSAILKEPPVYTDHANQPFSWLTGGELLNIELESSDTTMTLSIKLLDA